MPSSPCAAAAAWARGRSSSGSDRLRLARLRLARLRLARLLLSIVVLSIVVAGCTGDTDAIDRSAGGSSSTDRVAANATVERVVDGDTIVVDLAGERTRVRFIGIDTPESVDPRRPVECYGKEASAHLAELIGPGTAVRLERDAEQEDRYGRTLAYVYRAADGLFVNERMVADGYANTLTIPPNVAHVDVFRAAEGSARRAGLGLWTACPTDTG